MQNTYSSANESRVRGHQLYTSSSQGKVRLQHLQEAIKLFDEALTFFTLETYPEEWSEIRDERAGAQSELLNIQIANHKPTLWRRLWGPSVLSLWQRVAIVVLLLVVALVPATVVAVDDYIAQNNTFTCVPGSLHIDGSTALQDVVADVAAKYHNRCTTATINVQGGGSKTGLADVYNGAIQIGDSDIFAFPTQPGLVDHQVAVVIFTLVLNKDVQGITNLTTEQIKGIYTGVYTNWKQLNGPDLPIVALGRTSTSGTRYTFQKYILQGVETASGLANATSERDAVNEVMNTPGSICYTSLTQSQPLAQSHKLTQLMIDGVAPEVANVRNNTYHYWNIEHMYTKGPATGLTQAFINYMYSNDARASLAKFQLVVLTSVPKTLRDTHQF